jgi:site-specific DNA-methyltransferase (adenine-specific)
MNRKETIAEGVTLYLGDCRDWMQGLGPDDFTTSDVIVTDPPYGISLQTQNAGRDQRPYQKQGDIVRSAKTKKHDFEPIMGDDQPFDPSSLLLFPNLVLWGANNYADSLPVSHCWFSWDKKCGKASDSDIGDCELAWTRGIRFKTVPSLPAYVGLASSATARSAGSAITPRKSRSPNAMVY